MPTVKLDLTSFIVVARQFLIDELLLGVLKNANTEHDKSPLSRITDCRLNVRRIVETVGISQNRLYMYAYPV